MTETLHLGLGKYSGTLKLNTGFESILRFISQCLPLIFKKCMSVIHIYCITVEPKGEGLKRKEKKTPQLFP